MYRESGAALPILAISDVTEIANMRYFVVRIIFMCLHELHKCNS